MIEDDFFKFYDVVLIDNEIVVVSDFGCVWYCDIERNLLKLLKIYNNDWKIYVLKVFLLLGYCRGICSIKGKIVVCFGKDLDKWIIF